jgi:hypothetical protein
MKSRPRHFDIAFTWLVDVMTTLFRDNDQSNLDNIKFSVWNEFCECIVNIPIPLMDGASSAQ